MTYGIRWEPFFAFKNKYGWFDHFDINLFDQNVHSTAYANAPAGPALMPQYKNPLVEQAKKLFDAAGAAGNLNAEIPAGTSFATVPESCVEISAR